MANKYFSWSFDDGLEQDKRIIQILKKYGIGATFHLNSGLFGVRRYISRIGNLGMHETPADQFEAKSFHLLPASHHYRIPREELKAVYAGFEIASHTVGHVNLAKCSEEERKRQVKEDVDALSSLFEQEITGFSYPFGAGAKQSRDALSQAGIRYARLATATGSFSFPDDPLNMPLTCWHISPKTFQTLDQFIREKPQEEDMFFLMFAHGYEFDFGTKESNWEKLEKICETVSSHDDIICCSILDAFRMHENR